MVKFSGMDQQEFRARIRARLKETSETPVRVSEKAGLPRDSIRSVLRGHEPSILRADEICRALGITVTIGVCRAMPRKAAHPRTIVEYFADVVDGRLADLFGHVVGVYDRGRSDAEHRLMVNMLGHTVTMVSQWIASMEEEGRPPIKQFISAEEFDDVVE